MLKRRMVSIVIAVLLSLGIVAVAQAFTLTADVWRPGSPANTTYRVHNSLSDRGADWTNRTHEAAANWTNSTIFDFNFNNGSGNNVQTSILDCSALAAMYPNREAQGIYRSSFTIAVNVRTGCSIPINWYVGTGSIPSGHFDLRTVLRHEFGHAAGLNHVTGSSSQLMYPSVNTQTVKVVGTDDINAMDYVYGPNSGHRLAVAEYYYLPGLVWDNPYVQVGYKGANWWHGNGCCPLAFGQGLAWSDGAAATSWFPFVGERITWQYTKHWNRGTQDVYIDGNHKGSFTTYDANDTAWRTQKTWDLNSGTHVIEVRRQGPGGNAIHTDTDAFIINIARAPAGTYDSYNNSSVVYLGNGWTHCNTCGDPNDPAKQPHNRTISWSLTPNDAVVFTFVGSRIDYFFTKAYNRGKVKVLIDGDEVEKIDLYAPTTLPYNHQWRQSRYWTLPYGTHQISLIVTGETSAPNPADTYIDLDYFVVQ